MQNLEFKILAYLKDELDAKERLLVEQWVALSPANEKTFAEIEKIYLSAAYDSTGFQPNVDKAWAKVALAIEQSKTSSFTFMYRMAAMIALVAGLGFLVLKYQNSDELVAMTGDKEVRKIELTDGTVVWLNEHSKLTYSKMMADNERMVSLDGQAYFDVAKDAARPFRILGEKTTVEVLGTSFDLISKANYANVNVTSGLVSFALTDNNEIKVVLEKGNQATYKSNTIIKNEGFDVNASAWMTQDFVFKSSPLSQVVDVLSEHFDVKIKVDDAIRNCLITSSFEDKNLDQILNTLDIIANIKHEKKGKAIRLTGPGC
ncbi:FecR domain-containing protein [Reichenbachiella carrageenanivorans]|uniref:FecR domain-containing protein n=1 Tax=Reichenbachiella carrageenanivorans TaxID=2979869 RepID=A0ABY6CZG3_9BACT|nr:FecR domain-containing protein [Reichenbachiella carrageenanivorans]UXX79297.1 FecR domain-containing protein [Reichenbachiella carrageenanivorans]